MNGNRIHHILSLDTYTAPMFKGFSCPDLPLPSINALPAIIVLNSAPSWSAGEHWCLACFDKTNLCHFYDPFGKSPDLYGFTPQLMVKCNEAIRFNRKKVQNIASKTCGHHCMYFALHYARGYSPEEIMKTYHPTDTRKNDNMVFEYLQQMC